MSDLVSVVVPTMNNVETLDACLSSLRAQSIPIELIVIDNHSTDGTAAIAREHAHLFETAGPERSAQRNRGLELASGGFVCFIDSDMILEADVLAEATARLKDNQLVGAVVIPEMATGDGYLAACRGLEKELYLGNPDVEAARVFPTDIVRSVGGFSEDFVGGEDWDLADRIEALGFETERTNQIIWHEEGRVKLAECFKKKRYYGRGFAVYLDQRTAGRERRLARPAILRNSQLLRKPHLAIGLVLLKAVELAGLSLGVFEGRRSFT